MQVQVIDLQSENADTDFCAALKDIGFAVIANHGLDNALISDTYVKWREFFLSSENDKTPFLFDPKTHDGYIPKTLSETAKGYDKKDLKEFYHYFTNSRCPQHLLENTNAVKFSLESLAQVLLGFVQDNTPKEITEQFHMSLPEAVKDSKHTLLRIIHYPPLTGEEEPGSIRAAAHEDINFLTLLPASTAKGLQVQHSSGEWLDVPCDPNWIIINSGDMLEEATGGYYPSTTHRVINPENPETNQSRLAMPLFLHAHDHVQVSQRHTAASYRAERFAELGLI